MVKINKTNLLISHIIIFYKFAPPKIKTVKNKEKINFKLWQQKQKQQ